jgi:phytoene dehydrogenase-like protein
MTQYDAIIVGGGINGLVAGATLARKGRSVCILEQRNQLGGMATLGLDDGPALAHSLHNLSPLALKEIGLDPGASPFASEPLASVALCPEGNHVILRGNAITSADGTSHPDASAAQALLQGLAAYGDLLRALAEAPPPGGAALSVKSMRQLLQLGKVGWRAKGMGKAGIRKFLQVLLSNAYDLILDEIPDGPLAGLLAADAVRGAAAGPRSPGTVFNLIYRMGHGGTVRAPDGGIRAVIGAIAQAARDAGCRIETNKPVACILLEDDGVTGVELSDGSTLSAAKVFVNAGPQMALSLTGPSSFDIEATRRIQHIRARGTAAKVNIKLDRPLAIPRLPDDLAQARWVFAPSADYVETAFNPSKYGEMSPAPVIEAVQTTINDTHWLSAIVQYAPGDLKGGWTKTAQDRLRQITLDTLAQVVPDLHGATRDVEIITPDQIAVATGAPGGHWHHAEMSIDQLLTLRPAAGLSRYQIGPKGLYLCGASSHPGGDIMGLAGRNAALAAMEQAR